MKVTENNEFLQFFYEEEAQFKKVFRDMFNDCGFCKIPEKIEQKTQGKMNCVSTCVAMLFGLDVEYVTDKLHEIYMNCCFHEIFLRTLIEESGYVYSTNKTNFFQPGALHLVSANSLNMVGYKHQLLVDYRGEKPILYDPQYMKDDTNWYTLDEPSHENEYKLRNYDIEIVLYDNKRKLDDV